MRDSPAIARFQPDEWRTYRDLRLRALAESPDAFGSTLEAERVRPDGDWARRIETAARAPTELPLVARVGEQAVGLAWARVTEGEPEVAHLYQVWVAPEYRGRGVGQRLLEAVLDWARTAGVRHLALDVTRGDTPAVRLYARAGFHPAGDPQPLRARSPVMAQPMRLTLGGTSAPPA